VVELVQALSATELTLKSRPPVVAYSLSVALATVFGTLKRT
jgi:hypothetical protein